MDRVPISREALTALAYVGKNVATSMLLVTELRDSHAVIADDRDLFEARCRALFSVLADAASDLDKQLSPLVARLSLTST